MKWMALLSTLLLAACGLNNRDYVAYRQVIVSSPANKLGFLSDYPSVDVTHTTVKYH